MNVKSTKKDEPAGLGLCVKRVWRDWASYPCRSPGKYLVNGQPYCVIHDPEKKTRIPKGKVATTLWCAGFDRFCNYDEPPGPPEVLQVTAITHGKSWRITKGADNVAGLLGYSSLVKKDSGQLFLTREEAIDAAMERQQREIDELQKQLNFARQQFELLRKAL